MTPVALILGGGQRIGLSVANKLASTGYQVALGSRNPPTTSSSSIHPIPVDVSDPDSVAAAFARVRRDLGHPGVVVYNAAALSFPSNPGDPIGSIAPAELERDWRVNALGGYAALREAVEGFRMLKNEGGNGASDGVFIATGNVTPLQPMPMALTLGAGKAMLVHLVQLAVESCKDEGFRYVF
jgi:NAD(P)-dependent dehydrogenase (short-subunit alcohol dehydrogenase family)